MTDERAQAREQAREQDVYPDAAEYSSVRMSVYDAATGKGEFVRTFPNRVAGLPRVGGDIYKDYGFDTAAYTVLSVGCILDMSCPIHERVLEVSVGVKLSNFSRLPRASPRANPGSRTRRRSP